VTFLLVVLFLAVESKHGLNWHVPISGQAIPQMMANPVPLQDVRLTTDTFWSTALGYNHQYLNQLNLDSLLWNFRTTAGLPAPGTPYTGGWEDPTCELRGHFVGHWMSATARMWASTGDANVLSRMTSLVTELGKCQDAMKTGYLSAFPSEEFDRLEAHQQVWAPYYTIHKIMAGLLDQYEIANNTQALSMVTKMANYFYGRVMNVMNTQGMNGWQSILNVEWGGMNDVMYSLYVYTKNQSHLDLANLFDHYSWSRPLAAQQDDLPNNHANTHIPEIIGNQRAYEVVGNTTQQQISQFFYSTITTHHSWVTAGSNDNEYWATADRVGDSLNLYTEESCTQYNIQKVARHFFQWSADPRFFDFYERAMLSGLVGNIAGPGLFIYMMPIGSPGQTKGDNKDWNTHWGNPFVDFWCCYGTMIESFSKFGDSVYFSSPDNNILYITQFIPSTFSWSTRGVTITQKTTFPNDSSTSIVISGSTSGTYSIAIRVPSWATTGSNKITINGQPYTGSATPGSFAVINRNWVASDTITATFPMTFTWERIQDTRSQYSAVGAFFYGPLLLAGLTSSPILVGDTKNPSSWIVRTSSTNLTFTAHGDYNTDVQMLPLLFILHQKYTIYFNTTGMSIVPYNPAGSTIPSDSAMDWLCSGGAAVVSNPDLSLRSGNPNEINTVYLETGVEDSTHIVTQIKFAYSYVTGYSGGVKGSNFSVSFEDISTGATVLLYNSPVLTDYSYDKCNTCYSPPVTVTKSNLNLAVKTPQRVKFVFQNNDRNIQILLNINFVVSWN